MAATRPTPEFMMESAARAAALLRSISNENRLLILCLLIQHDEMSPSAMGEYFSLSQSALSQHLARMREDGLIAYRRESQTLYYRIACPEVKKLMYAMECIFCVA